MGHYRRMEAMPVVVCGELDDVCGSLSVYDLYTLHWSSAVMAFISETLAISRESCGAGDFWLRLKDQWY